MSAWIWQAFRRGILTSRYPRAPASPEEVPAAGRPPRPDRPGAAALAVDRCPVAAISSTSVDDGRCIRCARCLPTGFSFSGPVEASRSTRSGLLAPPSPDAGGASPAPLAALGRSLHLFLIDVGSCDACNREVLALANPRYDASRLGIFFTNSPRHADVLVVVGVPTPEMREPLRRAYEALPGPKAVVAVGVCAISGGVFAGTPGLAGSLEEIVPVDRYVPGCPPPPVAVLDAVLRLAGRGRPDREVR
jgi:Ni,Fe-hydrogenase III small subunit